MTIHPWTMYEIARARDEERLLRGLAAYHALRVRDERSAESVSTTGSGGRLRILDRLRRRDVRVTGSPARPAV
jgi:hypothetical protein